RDQRVRRVVGLLILGGERGPHREAQGVTLGGGLQVLHHLLARALLVLREKRQAVFREAVVGERLDRLGGGVGGLVGLGHPLIDARLRVGERLDRRLQRRGQAFAERLGSLVGVL